MVWFPPVNAASSQSFHDETLFFCFIIRMSYWGSEAGMVGGELRTSEVLRQAVEGLSKISNVTHEVQRLASTLLHTLQTTPNNS
jgi:hypothetical protein